MASQANSEAPRPIETLHEDMIVSTLSHSYWLAYIPRIARRTARLLRKTTCDMFQ